MDKTDQRNKNSIDETPLRTGPNGFDRFLQSTVWFDMQQLIKDRIKILTDRLVNAETEIELRAIKNQIKVWKEMLGMPSYLKSCAHAENPADQSELDIK